MEQEINIEQQLTELIAAPEKASEENAAMLKDLIRLYPYFQPLHLLLAKATMSGDGKDNLSIAALYNNGQLLYNFLHEPEHLISADFKVFHFSGHGQTANEPEELDKATIDEVPSDSAEKLADEQEVYEEIGELDIKAYQHFGLSDKFSAEEKPDFFAFQDNFQVEPVPEIIEEDRPVIETYKAEEIVEEDKESSVISKYDDDKLPYTFLWWLAKTRKEHQQIFQPYASPKQNKNEQKAINTVQKNPGELQQQYVEHIFHIQSPFNEEETDYSPANFKLNTTGSEIIERFIRNEPQISPPNPEQINNENKARKSAEDHNDLVSETLAKIYIEQMLYDKAIETYEKLSLKFPEKSRYFADLIQSIEKKI